MKSRPAETAGAIAGTGGLAAALAVRNWLAVCVAAVGYLPAIVTFIVGHGGVRGVARSLWSGNR